MTHLENYGGTNIFTLPCVVDSINFEKQMVLDVIIHKDQLLKKDDEISFHGTELVIVKKLKDLPIKTNFPISDRTNIRKVRYYCKKKQ